VWKWLKKIITTLDITQPILDAGCGNGKNMIFLLENKFEHVKGCDFSKNLVNICLNKKLDVVKANILCLPYHDLYFQNIICIAVLHHLSTDEHRKNAIIELLRVTKIGGKIFMSVASVEEPFCKKYKKIDDCGDIMAIWRNENDRYYHLFEKGEFEELCFGLNVNIESFFEKGNYIIILTKL
jgi:ubiquinone/menaquinone biosynthesis C-methylase UbiE